MQKDRKARLRAGNDCETATLRIQNLANAREKGRYTVRENRTDANPNASQAKRTLSRTDANPNEWQKDGAGLVSEWQERGGMTMKKQWHERTLPQKIASTAVWMLMIPAVVVAQIVRGKKVPRGK